MPPQPIPKSLAAPATLAFIATSKFVDGLPLYRQETYSGPQIQDSSLNYALS